MPKDQLSLSKSSLTFAKLAATPTEKAWSQAYNAGNLFACLSLNSDEEENLHTLQALGKDLFSNLEAEFFTLEEKNLTTITDAIQKSTKHIPETVSVDFCLAYFKEAVLYLFILGEGRVIMKRNEKLGVLLEGKQEKNTLNTASGYLQNDDVIIMETDQFANNVSDKHLMDSLELPLPSDIAEALSVHMHEKADGDQAAIIVVYHGVAEPTLEEEDGEGDIVLPAIQEEKEEISPRSNLPRLPKFPKLPPLPSFLHLSKLNLNHRKKFFLSISVIIFALLLISIFLTLQKQGNSKNAELFDSIYTQALKNYDEAKGLQNLNEALSQEDFQKAEKLLTDGRDKFPQGSKEDKQIEELLAKVQSELNSSGQQVSTNEVSPEKNNLLVLEKANPSGSGFSQNNDNVYYVTDESAFAIDKKSGKKTEIFKNDDYWKNAVATAPYQANLYVLDTKNGVLKFIPSGDSFDKNDYLKQSVNLNTAVSMAIDSAVWVLSSDGSIKKYLRGEAENFSVKSLDKPFANPTKIATNADTQNLYILDRGNSRIVKLGKDGVFQKQYSASIIKNASDFEVLEKDKKINILSGEKIYQIVID